jgi:hypothetical protein
MRFRGEMTMKLRDNEIFRWGGINRNYERTAKEWRDIYDIYDERDKTNNPYINCSCCNKPLPDDKPVYAGFVAVAVEGEEEWYRLKIFGKDCAYKIADNVIEP